MLTYVTCGLCVHCFSVSLTSDEEQYDGGGDEQLLEAGLLTDTEDEPPERQSHHDTQDTGDRDGLSLRAQEKCEGVKTTGKRLESKHRRRQSRLG